MFKINKKGKKEMPKGGHWILEYNCRCKPKGEKMEYVHTIWTWMQTETEMNLNTT